MPIMPNPKCRNKIRHQRSNENKPFHREGQYHRSLLQIQISSMTSHRKQELLKELDTALNRKVQEKYFKIAKTQQLPTVALQNQVKNTDRFTNDPKIYRSNDYQPRSPNSKHNKDSVKLQRPRPQVSPSFGNTIVQPQRGPSPRDEKHRKTVVGDNKRAEKSSSQVRILQQKVKTLEEQNCLLAKELSSLKSAISSLEHESKSLKRDEREYLSLKELNSQLKQQLEVSRLNERKTARQGRGPKTSLLLDSLNFQESLKQTMMQLGISFINKEWNEGFVIDAMRSINKEVFKVKDEKSKATAKLNKFDVDSVLLKENNETYKQQISNLQLALQNYEAELSACNTTIKELEQQFSALLKEKKLVESKYREACKEMETYKKQIKLMESSKHRKPKREASVLKNRQSNIEESTVVRISVEKEAQTEGNHLTSFDDSVSNAEAESQKAIIENIKLQIHSLSQKLTEAEVLVEQTKDQLCSSELQAERLGIEIIMRDKQIAALGVALKELEEKSRQQEEYIRQMELKSEEINRDISNFMPQLKRMEQENCELKQASAQKDAEIISRHQIINEIRAQNDALQERNNAQELQIQQLSRQLQKTHQELSFLNNNLAALSNKNSELENSIVSREADLQANLAMKLKSLSGKLRHQEDQFRRVLATRDQEAKAIRTDLEEKTAQLQAQTQANKKLLEDVDNLREQSDRFQDECRGVRQAIEEKSSTFLRQKQKLREAVQQIMILHHELAKKQTQYESQYHSLESRILGVQTKSSQITQSYSHLQNNLSQLQAQIIRLKEINLRQFDENEAMAAENRDLRYQVQVGEEEMKTIESARHQLEQRNEEMQQRNQQLQIQNQQLKKDISALSLKHQESVDKLNQLQAADREASVRSAEIQYAQQNSLASLNQRVQTLLAQKQVLQGEVSATKQQADAEIKRLIQQVSNQSYDVERLLREKRQLEGQLRHMGTLYESKSYQENDFKQRAQQLTSQNESLQNQNRYLIEELEMKDRNKEQDNYIHQLKNKQYCLLIKKILASIIDLQELEHCLDIEQLLEIGSQRVVQKKRENMHSQQLADHHKYSYGQNQYEFNINTEKLPRRFNFGVQVSSYQELVLLSSRQREIDGIKEQESQVERGGQISSPRSLILNLSPASPREGRTQRIITEYRNFCGQEATSQSKKVMER